MLPHTPEELGYRWPAEWEPHQATWLAWPHNRQTWPGRFAHIPAAFARLIACIAEFETVHVLAGGALVMEQAQAMVGHLANVVLHPIPTNDAWVRDYGPMFLVRDAPADVAAVAWRFNSWGRKYPPWDLDAAAADRICRRSSVPCFHPGVVLEGGAVDGNGRGILMTTESCLLDARRNPNATRSSLEEALRRFACVREVLWLPGGRLVGDDTDGHIDQIARFVNPNTVVLAVEPDPSDANHAILAANRRRLETWRGAYGQSLTLVPLPMPPPLQYRGQRVPASYCNFYLANSVVVLPGFHPRTDQEAARILADLLPDRAVRIVDARELVWGLGAVHCLTQQQPAKPIEMTTG